MGDFTLRGGRVYLRQTGNSAAIDVRLAREVASWLLFTVAVRVRGAIRRVARGRGASIWFAPDRPHARYMVRAAATWTGMRIAADARAADIAFYFEDSTSSRPASPPAHLPHFNFACSDIGKTRVAEAFEKIFGYPLLVDPLTSAGEAVEKSEANGAHDGRIVACPRPARPGRCYQRLIDTLGEDGLATDLRTHCIGRRPVLVWVKRRAAAERFLPPNLTAALHAPEAVFSAEEIARIALFCEEMGADWCGLDILRDRDGRIYIVDVNKTDAGPVVALPFTRKLASIALMGDALAQMVAREART